MGGWGSCCEAAAHPRGCEIGLDACQKVDIHLSTVNQISPGALATGAFVCAGVAVIPDISFESNIRDWTRSLDEFQRRAVPEAVALALTWTAFDVRDYHKQILPQIFDRPTRFTVNSVRVSPARRSMLVAGVFFKDYRNRAHYLMPNVEGGSRPRKRFEQWLIKAGYMASNEFAVPGSGARLDRSGNMSQGEIVKILSQLAASPDATQWETARSRKRAGASRARYFVPPRNSSLARGVWMRTGKKAIKPVLIFVSAVKYSARYDFDGLSVREASRMFPRKLDRALATVMRRHNQR